MTNKPIARAPLTHWLQRYWPDLLCAVLAAVCGIAWLIGTA